jgi:hypothetical protein
MYTTSLLRVSFTCAYDWYFQVCMLRLEVGEDYG